ncbi:hypothetical protein LOTGIDRAFT_206699 [Lottia gigantea]|uniref:Uncharacterized protein n=1 Tax=Lottia gigantea TaxID=225164 RepID=V4BPD8_LOTGI|nr:hypothetical protein LOTGIDRAFT_206699 [Lottia gigantea]ESO90829.1 hypothetical protein LOTGIDRAFT_206699 [Lottia gigantea]
MKRLLQSKYSTVLNNLTRRNIHYVQGQSPEPKIREYFYFIDHQGQLFLDDAKMKNFTSCFKEKAFLKFFFTRIKKNESGRYEQEFPYISPCGRERNFIHCDDRPIVYTHILPKFIDNKDYLSYGGAGDLLTVLFEPEKVCMLPQSGRVYHPASLKYGGVGLIKSSLAIEFSKHFEFENGEENPPTQFTWNNERLKLTNEILPLLHENSIEE